MPAFCIYISVACVLAKGEGMNVNKFINVY